MRFVHEVYIFLYQILLEDLLHSFLENFVISLFILLSYVFPWMKNSFLQETIYPSFSKKEMCIVSPKVLLP